MANPTPLLGASKSFVHNVSETIASNLQACAFKIRQSPTAQITAQMVAAFAPTVISAVFTYYAPARVTFLAVCLVCSLSTIKIIELESVDKVVVGVALGILLAKSVVATVVFIALIGIAKIPEVEDTDSDMEPILPLVDDSSEEPNNEEPSSSGKEPSELKSKSAESSEDNSDNVSADEDSSEKAITQEECCEEPIQLTLVKEKKFMTAQEVVNKINAATLASIIESEQELSAEVEAEDTTVVAIQVEEIKTEKEDETTTEIVVSAIIVETANTEEIK